MPTPEKAPLSLKHIGALTACMLIPAVSTGAFITSYALWVVPWIKDFKIPHTTAVAGFTIGILMMAVSLPVVGICVARFSAKTCVMTGGVFLAVGFLFASRSTSFWEILVLFATLLSWGAALTSVLPSQSVGVQMLPHKAGMISGAVAMGAAVGGMVVPAIVTMPLTAYGWRSTFVIIGVIVFVSIVLTALLIPKAPAGDKTEGHGTDTSQPPTAERLWWILRTRPFWLAIICVVPGYFVVGAVQANAVAIATDRGIPIHTAELLVPIIPAGAAVGSLLVGWLCDHFDYRWIFATVGSAIALGLLVLLYHSGVLSLASAFAVFGVIFGGAIPIAGIIVTRNFTSTAFPRVMGWIFLLMYLSMSVGPMVAAKVRDSAGTYNVIFGYFALFMLVSVFAVLLGGATKTFTEPAKSNRS